MSGRNSIKRTCKNCADFDAENNVCTIRYTILEDKSKTPMKRKPNQNGCKVHMYKTVSQK
ncbi:hypothetical protein tloyanaT_13170 [Thalassotalea loyana]|uniref:Uncharacterized protein n=1 Tax=Thalassotalea loyana TaxID=280483 RepID=A0ABQ6HAB8_9GAMM|nr:hypothetical protein tloyanaT_13170 [Thalassotalea loyana]